MVYILWIAIRYILNRLPSESNPRETNLQIDKYLISILKAAKGKDDAAPKRRKKISFAPGKDISVSTEKDTESEGGQESESEDQSDMAIESEDKSQVTNFSEVDNENHDPKQSSRNSVKGSLKSFDWVVVKYDIASSSKSKVQFNILSVKIFWRRGVLVITTAQLHSTKAGLRFCTGSNPAHSLLEIRDGEDL